MIRELALAEVVRARHARGAMSRAVWALWLAFAMSGCVVVAGGQQQTHSQARPAVWQPATGHAQVEIWPGVVPDPQPTKGPEKAENVGPKDFVAGRTWVDVENVSRPTMTVYPPKGKNTGVAVVVFPGGGYEILAIDLEGTEVCDWLVQKGITCVLLKYRVPAPRSKPYWGAYPQSPIALEDAQRTLGLVRLHAKDWGVDPHKIGVMGFSAGGHLVAAMSVHFDKRLYAAVDQADQESCRPDFAVALYPGHLSFGKGVSALNPDIEHHLTRNAPPTFLLQNEDDNVDSVYDSLTYYLALKRTGVPVELHLYATGGHAFGLRRTDKAATEWPSLMERWLRTIGMIGK